MKLKDYKKNPEQYAELKKICNERGIVANDETEMSEILRQNNTLAAQVRKIGNKFERKNK